MDIKSLGTKEDLEKSIAETYAKQDRIRLEIDALESEFAYLDSTAVYLTKKLELINSDTYKGLTGQCDTER